MFLNELIFSEKNKSQGQFKYIVYLVSSELTVQLAAVVWLCILTAQQPLRAQLQETPQTLQMSFRTSLELNIILSC